MAIYLLLKKLSIVQMIVTTMPKEIMAATPAVVSADFVLLPVRRIVHS